MSKTARFVVSFAVAFSCAGICDGSSRLDEPVERGQEVEMVAS